MRSKSDHEIQAARNEAFYHDLGGREAHYDEWALVGLFYVMVHAANSFLVSQGAGRTIKRHKDRRDALELEAGPEAAAMYQQFYSQSRLARYECAHFQTHQLQLYQHQALNVFPTLLRPPTKSDAAASA